METTFGLEGDLQIALRFNIEQLEQGLLRCSTTPVVWQFHPYLSTILTFIFSTTTYALSSLPHEKTSFVELSAVWRLGSCGRGAHI